MPRKKAKPFSNAVRPENGDKFKSQFERDGYQQILNLIDRHKAHVSYEVSHFKYDLPHRYTTDFTLIGENGKEIYLEYKGRFTSRDRTKLLQVKKQHPEADIRLVFMQDQKLYKSSKQRYSDWADKYGFLWSHRKVPYEWIKELYN